VVDRIERVEERVLAIEKRLSTPRASGAVDDVGGGP
jgi:hypothetical protein